MIIRTDAEHAIRTLIVDDEPLFYKFSRKHSSLPDIPWELQRMANRAWRGSKKRSGMLSLRTEPCS